MECFIWNGYVACAYDEHELLTCQEVLAEVGKTPTCMRLRPGKLTPAGGD